MKIAHLAAAAALALGTVGAYAVTGPIDLSTGSAGFFNTPSAGGFLDIYTFTLGSTGTVNGSVTSVVNGIQDVDFSSIVIAGPSGSFAFSLLNPDPVEVWALPAAGVSLGAGAYTLTLIGINSAAVGSYGGNIAVTVVPKPETLALLLAGLGVVGFVARRRG